MDSRHKPQGYAITCTYSCTFRALFAPRLLFLPQANPALLSVSPTLNEPAQKFFCQIHLSTQNMATLQHLPVILAHLSTNSYLVILGVCTFLFFRWISARRLNLPPGPTPVPFIGNLHQISFHSQELRFAEWGRVFGTVVSRRRSCVTFSSE